MASPLIRECGWFVVTISSTTAVSRCTAFALARENEIVRETSARVQGTEQPQKRLVSRGGGIGQPHRQTQMAMAF